MRKCSSEIEIEGCERLSALGAHTSQNVAGFGNHIKAKAKVGLPPDFLSNLLALANFMRLSLSKAAHADAGGAS